MEAWIQTYTGKHMNVFNPRVEDICIEDIAHSLALKCRYNGHCRTFYSVAEHCIRMSIWDLPGSPVWRLMHDAAEGYLPDVCTPIKQRLVGFESIEDSLLEFISAKFGLTPYNKEEIHEADQIMGSTEARDLMGDPKDWALEYPPYHGKIIPCGWEMAEKLFLVRARQLGVV